MRIKIICYFLLICLCFNLGCVPTPEENAVINKNDGVMQAAIYATALPEQHYEAPKTLQIDAFGPDNYRIEVDAEVIIPDIAVGYDDGPFEKAGYTEMQQSYVLWLTPTIGGVPTTYREDAYDLDLGNLDEKLYAPLMWYEYIQMQVRDDGVEYMYWANPAKISAILNENVTLLPFSEIVERFKQQIQYHSIPIQSYQSGEVRKKTVHIDRIVLGMMQVRKKNYPDVIQMIPTWTFFGTGKVEYEEPFRDGRTGQQTTVEKVEIPAYSYLILNAIDGSMINPKYGY